MRGLTKGDILQFYRLYLAPHSPSRRKLSCHVVSTLKAAGAGGEVAEVTPTLSSTDHHATKLLTLAAEEEAKFTPHSSPSETLAILDLTEFKILIR